MDGWISIHRKIMDCWIWNDEPFSKGQAWVDLLLLANHQDKKISFDGGLVTVKAGQRLTSIKQLSERWRWSRHKVSDFLNLLEKDEMIEQKRDNKKTLITIVNYEVYQGENVCEGHQKDIKRTSKGHQKDTNNNENNNNKKNILLSFDKEFDALYKPYPRKRGKAPAKKKFIAWVTTGSTYAGQRYKFTIDEIFEAVNYYVETKEEWREWKDFSTLMNQIPDFVEGAKERDK